jgi:hypothetical protein
MGGGGGKDLNEIFVIKKLKLLYAAACACFFFFQNVVG